MTISLQEIRILRLGGFHQREGIALSLTLTLTPTLILFGCHEDQTHVIAYDDGDTLVHNFLTLCASPDGTTEGLLLWHLVKQEHEGIHN